MEYTVLGKQNKVAHLKDRIATLEQEHYNTKTSMELLERCGETETQDYKKLILVLESLDRVHALTTDYLKELEASAEEPSV